MIHICWSPQEPIAKLEIALLKQTDLKLSEEQHEEQRSKDPSPAVCHSSSSLGKIAHLCRDSATIDQQHMI